MIGKRVALTSVAFTALVLVSGGCAIPPSPPSKPLNNDRSAAPGGVSALVSTTVQDAPAQTPGAQPRLATDPLQLAEDLIADELALRDNTTPEVLLVAAARRQQVAYRVIGRHPEWDSIIRPRIPPWLLETYELNIDARRQLAAMATPKDTLPPWTIIPPVPADELLSYYHAAETETGVEWAYLAAINLIETRLGSIQGLSTAGAQGPMQFLPTTFAAYGMGGDINSPYDSIMAAGRMLRANGFAADRDSAIFSYNHSDRYVAAVSDYAAAIAADPATFTAYYRWDVYYVTTAGDVLLPVGYSESSRIPVETYLVGHPQ